MPYMDKIAQLMNPQPTWGRKYRYFCDPSSRFRDTAVFLTLNGKLALISY